MSKIIQSDNYAANFGYCLRSSSIFYVPPQPITTSIVISNYWSFKNNLKIFLLVNWRRMNGELVRRVSLDFNNKNVSTLIPPSEFSGSCEIEAFSSHDMRIPYSAIMAVYETRKSISMVHSYSRTYSQIEVEDGRTISDGHEGCWVLRDCSRIRSFAVIHNGSGVMPAQKISLVITNYSGISKKVQWTEEKMNPFETRTIYPRQHFTNLDEFLGGHEGTCVIDYELNKSFTRMLLGWESVDKSQLQVTHSNFDYSKHETDFIESYEPTAYMSIPIIQDSEVRYIIYPDRSPGDYLIRCNEKQYHELPLRLWNKSAKSGDKLRFCKKDGKLPTRIVTAIQLKPNIDSNIIPCECSLGVVHELRPAKRFHWGVWSYRFNSRLLITSYPEIYGEIGNPQVIFRFYGENTTDIAERKISWKEISDDGANASLKIGDICPDEQYKKDKYGYISIWSEYGGFWIFTTLSKHQSVSLEHTF